MAETIERKYFLSSSSRMTCPTQSWRPSRIYGGVDPPIKINHLAKLAAAIFLIISFAPLLLADGLFVWKGRDPLREPAQKAVIHWHAGVETMVLQVKYVGTVSDFAWVVPLPSRPDVSAVAKGDDPFDELSNFCQSREDDLHRYRIGSDGANSLGLVEVLEHKRMGVYDVAVLAASDSRALAQWLAANGFRLPSGAEKALAPYTKADWVWVAMRIHPEAGRTGIQKKLREGRIQPLRFRFRCRKMVYPLRISSINIGPTELQLYLLGSAPTEYCGRLQVPGLSPAEALNIASLALTPPGLFNEQWGSYLPVSLKDLPITWQVLGLPSNGRLHLVECHATFQPAQMTEDLYFRSMDPVAYWTAQFQRAGSAAVRLHAVGVLHRYQPELAATCLDRELSRSLGNSQNSFSQDEGQYFYLASGRVFEKVVGLACQVFSPSINKHERSLAAYLTAVIAANRYDKRWQFSDHDSTPRYPFDLFKKLDQFPPAIKSDLTVMILNRLAASDNTELQAWAIRHPQTTVYILESVLTRLLARYPTNDINDIGRFQDFNQYDFSLLYEVAGHPLLPNHFRRILLELYDPDLRFIVVANCQPKAVCGRGPTKSPGYARSWLPATTPRRRCSGNWPGKTPSGPSWPETRPVCRKFSGRLLSMETGINGR